MKKERQADFASAATKNQSVRFQTKELEKPAKITPVIEVLKLSREKIETLFLTNTKIDDEFYRLT